MYFIILFVVKELMENIRNIIKNNITKSIIIYSIKNKNKYKLNNYNHVHIMISLFPIILLIKNILKQNLR
jgi:hypothetical protein